MKKKVVKMFTAATVAASVVAPVASAAAFEDVSATNSHADAIAELVNRGVINGYEDGTYRPNETLTRAQAAKILANVLELNTTSTKQVFSDVPATSGYIGAINALANAGIINGYEDGTFKPNAPLTRGQMAKILVNAFNLEKSQQLTHNFKDVSAANGYNVDIQTLVDYNITQGTTQSTYEPTSAVKRGQMASFVVRAEKAVKTAVNTTENKEASSIVVSSITGTTLTTANGSYDIDASLQAILSEANSKALANAKLTATIENNRITALSKIELTASGSKNQALVFNGKGATLNGSITVLGNYVTIKNVKIAKDVYVGGQQTDVTFDTVDIAGAFNVVQEPAKVASLTAVETKLEKVTYQFVNSTVATLNVGRNLAAIVLDAKSTITKTTIASNVADVTLQGTFKEVVVAANEVKINGQATIQSLLVNSPTAKIALDVQAKVTSLVLPTGANAASIISNYDAIKQNISTVTNASKTVSAGGTSSGGSSSSSSNNRDNNKDRDNGAGDTTDKTDKEPAPSTTTDSAVPKVDDPNEDKLRQEKPQLTVSGQEVSGTIVEVLKPYNLATTVDTTTVDATTVDTTTVDTTTVKVRLSNGETYTLAAELEEMFRYNADALQGTGVKVIVNNGRIEAITELSFGEDGPRLLDGGGKVVIYGNVYVSNSLKKFMNITVTGDVVLKADRARNVEFRQATVFGKVKFEDAKVALLNAKFAGLSQVAAATTRIEIAFLDSSVAIIEVTKDDVDLYAGGSTEVASVRLFSNATLDALDLSNNKILPKIVIGQGVTNVVLNASIASVIINSDENIVVSGRGNFGEVQVNTTKEVALDTIGTIGNLQLNAEQPKVSLGDNLEAISTITTSLPVEKAITNFDSYKGQVKQVIVENAEFFAAELVPHDTKFGYFYLKLAETKGHKVMYKLFDTRMAFNQHVDAIKRNVTAVPTDALTYTEGEAIAIPGNKFIIAYVVSDNGQILDFENKFDPHDTIRFTSTTAGTRIETTLEVTEGSKASDTYEAILRYRVGEPVVFLDTVTLSQYKWTKSDNLGVITVPGTVFTAANDKEKYVEYEVIQAVGVDRGYVALEGGENAKDTGLKIIKDAYERSKAGNMSDKALNILISIVFEANLITEDWEFAHLDKEKYRASVEQAKSLEELYTLMEKINGANQ